jgi:hypothetical protein
MGVSMTPGRRPGMWLSAACLLFALVLLTDSAIAAGEGFGTVPDVVVKAALLFNFVKFTEWPSLRSGAPILACIVGDQDIAAAFVDTVRGQRISGHLLEVSRDQSRTAWPICQMLFVTVVASQLSTAELEPIKHLPILTVSDASGFADTGGIIELYPEGGRMRFAINVDAAERSGLRLSSRLLGLAKIIRNDHGQ